MKPTGTKKNKPTKGASKKKEEEILKKLKDYEDHKLLDAEIARYRNPGYKEDYFKPLDAEIAEYVARNKPTRGTKKNKVEHEKYAIKRAMKEGNKHLKNLKLYDPDCTLFEEKIAKGEASMKKELAEKQKDEGWEEQEDEKSAIKRLIEGETHLKSWELTPLEEEIVKVEPSTKRELAEKQKDEGWEEQEDEKSAIKRPMEEGETHLKSWELTPLEEEIIKEVEPSIKFTCMAGNVFVIHEDKRWSLEEEVNKLIDEALERSFPGLGEKSETFICKEEYGDYQCESVLSIWPKLIEEGTEPKGPKSVGMTIKMELEKRSDMIEGTPCVRSFGFVTFKLSGKWMAKSLNKMVRYGIETWAPKLGFKRVIVEEITDYESSIVGTIRSSFIRDTFIRMLEYSQVSVNASKDEFMRDALSHVSDDKWSFSIEDIDGDAVTSCIVEGKLESLNFGKREIQDVSDSLKILWYALKVERADWIVCLSPVRHLEYVEMCFTAAGWIPTTEDHKFSFAGYRTHAEPGKLDYLLENALTRCNSLVKQGKAPEYTAEQVFCCALRYEYLKNPRMAECSFTVDEMFNEKGNTFLYLLNTKSQVLSVLANFGKDINLKNVSELILEKVEVLEKDKGRALGFHLLLFTQILEESCFSVLPHILCQYLHDLSQKFTSYNSSYSRVSEDGSVAETSRLILCEATAAVMEKCFHLLGITPVSISGELLPKPLEILSELKSSCYDSVIPLARYPPKNSRFEIMAICPQINRDLDFKSGKLFGRILVHDKHGFLSDGWVPTYSPDFGMVSLFSSDWYDSVDMVNLGLVSLGNPMSRHSIPLTTSTLRMRAELVVTNEREDAFYHLQSTTKRLRFLDFRDIKGDGECGKIFLGGEDMSVVMYSITLKDAVDTNVEVKFGDIDAHRKVKGYIYAYYGSKFPYLNDFDMGFYTATLLEPSTITAGPVRLSRSKIAVPKKGSLVIDAKFVDVISRKVVLAGRHEFHSKIKGESRHTIRGRIGGCSLHLKVDWKYQA